MNAVDDRGPTGTYGLLRDGLPAHRTDRQPVSCPHDTHPNAQRTAAPRTVGAALVSAKWPPYLVRCSVILLQILPVTLSADRL